MKVVSSATLLIAFQILAAPIWAETINAKDYPVQYQVMDSSKKPCTVNLRDQAKQDMAIDVSRNGSCHPLDKGKIHRGRQNEKKNEIEPLILGDKGKARVEEWHIDGIVNITPRSQ
jgi:hypothetical protein